jgi:hypothetical protein
MYERKDKARGFSLNQVASFFIKNPIDCSCYGASLYHEWCIESIENMVRGISTISVRYGRESITLK